MSVNESVICESKSGSPTPPKCSPDIISTETKKEPQNVKKKTNFDSKKLETENCILKKKLGSVIKEKEKLFSKLMKEKESFNDLEEKFRNTKKLLGIESSRTELLRTRIKNLEKEKKKFKDEKKKMKNELRKVSNSSEKKESEKELKDEKKSSDKPEKEKKITTPERIFTLLTKPPLKRQSSRSIPNYEMFPVRKTTPRKQRRSTSSGFVLQSGASFKDFLRRERVKKYRNINEIRIINKKWSGDQKYQELSKKKQFQRMNKRLDYVFNRLNEQVQNISRRNSIQLKSSQIIRNMEKRKRTNSLKNIKKRSNLCIGVKKSNIPVPLVVKKYLIHQKEVENQKNFDIEVRKRKLRKNIENEKEKKIKKDEKVIPITVKERKTQELNDKSDCFEDYRIKGEIYGKKENIDRIVETLENYRMNDDDKGEEEKLESENTHLTTEETKVFAENNTILEKLKEVKNKKETNDKERDVIESETKDIVLEEKKNERKVDVEKKQTIIKEKEQTVIEEKPDQKRDVEEDVKKLEVDYGKMMTRVIKDLVSKFVLFKRVIGFS